MGQHLVIKEYIYLLTYFIVATIFGDGGKNNEDDAEIVSARIFCGMENGKVDVFDMDTPLLVHHLFPSKNKIVSYKIQVMLKII